MKEQAWEDEMVAEYMRKLSFGALFKKLSFWLV
jgi:hypothetical protein